MYKLDGTACQQSKAYCFRGQCRTHSDQCRLLWGYSGQSSEQQCYAMNTKGTRHGNCGYNLVNKSYVKCQVWVKALLYLMKSIIEAYRSKAYNLFLMIKKSDLHSFSKYHDSFHFYLHNIKRDSLVSTTNDIFKI